MRLRFEKGKQKELIKNFKNMNKFTWAQLSDFLEIKYGRLNSYYYEEVLIPEEVWFKLDPKKRFSRFILERLDEKWGVIKGGKNSTGTLKKINYPEFCSGLAEFYGIMLGDGCSHRTSYHNSREDKRGVYTVRVIGHSILDKKYHLDYVKPLIEKLFNINVRVCYIKNTNAMYLECHSKNLVEFFEKIGFPPGNKIKNKLKIPIWIRENEDFLKVCLRGLYDTDGSVYKLTNQNSHQICFTNMNSFLMDGVRNSLLSFGIMCSKISGKDLYVTKKSELRKFLKLIGFCNNRHLSKVKMWKLNSPVV